MRIAGVAGGPADWRRRMCGELFFIFLAKLAALALLWALFFSAAHRATIDRSALNRQLGVAPPAASSRPPPTSSIQETSRG